MNINRRVIALVATPALMMLGLVAFAPSASAHEATFEATCDGVRVHTTRDYEPQQHNHWTVTVGGEVHSGTFGASLDETFPVPQEGASTDWSASIDVDESDQYDRSDSGTVGPCGQAPPPDYSLSTSHAVACGSVTLTLHNVSPWIYPASYSTDGTTPDASGPNYGPVVDNRGDAPDDQTGTKTLTFGEDTGTHTVKYVVAAGTESDLYRGQSVGKVTTVTVESDCEANIVELPVPPEPQPTAPKCDEDGSLTIGETEGVNTFVDGARIHGEQTYGVGTHEVIYRPRQGYAFDGQPNASYTVDVKAASGDCEVDVPPVQPPGDDTPPPEDVPEDTPPTDNPPTEDTPPVDTPPAEQPPAEQPPVHQVPDEQPPAIGTPVHQSVTVHKTVVHKTVTTEVPQQTSTPVEHAGQTLPNTGIDGSTLWALLGAITAFGAAFLLFVRGRRA